MPVEYLWYTKVSTADDYDRAVRLANELVTFGVDMCAVITEENVRAMIRCNIAHTVMLYGQYIISWREASKFHA
jgi:hypothetical protein